MFFVIFKNIIDSATGQFKEPANVMVAFEKEQIHYIETIKSSFKDAIEYIKNTLVDGLDIKDFLHLTREDVKEYVYQLKNALSGFEIKNRDLVNSWSETPSDTEEFKLIKHQLSNKIHESLSETPDLQKFYNQFIGKHGLNPLYLIKDDMMSDNYVGWVYEWVEGLQDRFKELQKAYKTTATSVEEYEREHPEVSESNTLTEKESLQQIVNAAVEAIKTNASNVEANTTDNSVLTAIKTAVESINKKIVQGTKVIDTGKKKTEEKKDDKPDVKNPKESGNAKSTKNQDLQELSEKYEELGRLQAEVNYTDSAETFQEVKGLQKVIDAETQRLNLTKEQIEALKEKQNAANEDMRQSLEAQKIDKERKEDLKETIRRNKETNRINAAKSSWNAGNKTLESLWKIDGKTDPLSLPSVQELISSLKELDDIQQQVNESINKGTKTTDNNPEGQRLKENIDKLKAAKMAVDEQTASVKELISNYEKLSSSNPNVEESGFTANISGDVEAQLRKTIMAVTHGRAKIGEFDAATQSMKYTVKSGAYEFKEYEMAVRQADHAIVKVHNSTKKTETFLEGLKRKLKELSTYFSASSLIYKAFNSLRKGIQYIREIDSALTELKKVTDETEETYDKFLKTAAKTADKVGSTIKDVVSSTADWARLGYSMEDAIKFAESTQILMNVSEFTNVSDATDTLISAVQAFKYTAEESMDVVDILNTIGNNYAISTADLAQSLTKSSAALVAANGTLEEAVALTAAANTIVQDADSVGTSLKTTSMRLRGTSTEILEAEGLDTDGAVASKSKLQSQIKAISGVDILTQSGEYKSTYEILSQIAEVWEDISDVDQAALLELIAGKRNASTIAAILQNPDILKDAFESANDAEGSALKENETQLDSIEGRITRFTNAVQTMWKNTLDSDVVKWFVDLGTKIVKLIDKIGLVKSAFIAFATFTMIKNKKGPIGYLASLGEGFKSLTKKIKTFKVDFKGSLTRYITELTSAGREMQEAAEKLKNLDVGSLTDTFNKAGVKKEQQNAFFSQMGIAGQDSKFKIDQKTFNADAIANALNGGIINKDNADQIAKVYGLTGAYKELNAEQMKNAMQNLKLKDAQIQNITSTLGLTDSTTGLATGSKFLTQSQIQQAFASNGLTAAEGTQAAANVGLTATNTTLASSFMALWAACWPVLVVMLAIGAAVAVIVLVAKAIDNAVVTTAELEEELEGLVSELNDLEDQLESLNSELETTQERIAELTAMETLSLTEQDELETLRARNAELERQIELTKNLAEAKQGEVTETANDLIAKAWNKQADFKKNKDGELEAVDKDSKANIDTDDYLESTLKSLEIAYKNGKKINQKELDNINKILSQQMDYINEYEIEYGQSDELDAYLDEVYGAAFRASRLNGKSVQAEAAKTLFDNTGNQYALKLKEQLTEVAKDDTLSESQKLSKGQNILSKALNNTSGNYDKLKNSMKAFGLTADEVVRYFIQLSKASDSDTVEGITAQYQKGIEVLQKYKNNARAVIATFTDLDGTVEKITWNDLFNKDGEVDDIQISKALQGADEETRKAFSKLVRDIKDGEITVEQAINSFNASGVVRGFKLVETQIADINADVFKDLGDDLSGVIDTLDEFSASLESVASSIDLVNQAQAEMANSGRISVETALQLMQTTDNWNELLEIEDGSIRLVSNATEVLVQSKLDLVKQNIQAALSTVEAQLAEIEATQTSADMAYTIEESTNLAVTQLAGNMAYLTKIMEGYARTAAGETVNMATLMGEAEAARAKVLEDTNYKKNSAEKIGTETLEKRKKELEAMLGMLEGVDTVDEFKNNYASDDVSGGADTADEVANNKFKEAMSYWENRISANQAKYEQIQNEIDLLETKGMRAGEEYYREQIEFEKQRQSLLEQQKVEALAYLKVLDEGSDEWWEVADTINGIEGELDDVTASIQEMNDAIGQIRWDGFEELHDRFSNLKNDLENIRDILSNEDMFDDEGNFTKEGVATLAAHIYDIQLDKNALADVQEELADFQQGYEGNEDYFATIGIDSEQEYYDKLVELTDKQDDYVKQIKDSEQSVVEMYENQIDAIEEYISKLTDGYNDYIDSCKEALDSERDLFDFKKNVQKQTKDIASLERRIAALSGSSNASDIAERRKLEAELYDAKEGLSDTYYDHAKNAQSQALDDEAQAYEESMNKYVESLRTMLEEATKDMTTFLSSVTNVVVQNAGSVEDAYNNTGLAIDSAIITPWTEAAEAMEGFEDDALSRMNDWTKSGENGYFYNFNINATEQLESPWSAGATAANTFATNVNKAMSAVYDSVQSNVDKSLTKLNSFTDGIKDTDVKPDGTIDTAYPTTSNKGSGGNSMPNADVKKLQYVLNHVFNAGIDEDGSYGPATIAAVKRAQKAIGIGQDGYYGPNTKAKMEDYIRYKWQANNGSSSAIGQGIKAMLNKLPTSYYAKGTLGTSRSEWAITDELGEELVLVPSANGNLSFMRKGTSVIPADITANLIEWGQLDPDMIKVGGGANINMINNAVNKPEINLDIAEFLHVDKVDKDTMDDLEKFVDKKMNDLVRQLNYSIKKFK